MFTTSQTQKAGEQVKTFRLKEFGKCLKVQQ